ncbi:DUF2236 domain-containing protein [Streptomyces sp. SID7803]|nr:DUF2236 domain-containing protein [Streptomyces sp. SID7803]
MRRAYSRSCPPHVRWDTRPGQGGGRCGEALRPAEGDPTPRSGTGLPGDLPDHRDVRVPPLGHHPRLELALYRTYAVPSIGRLLAETAELTDRSQKRYDDTALLLDTVVEHGFDSDPGGRTALRRINRMHAAYDISNNDMRYVLCTFVVTPEEVARRVRMAPAVRPRAAGLRRVLQDLGAHMGIKDLPRTYEDFERTLDTYEDAHFGWDEAPGRSRTPRWS